MITFISDRGNVSRAEIDAYYRQGIAALITEVVDAEFNKIEFGLDKTAQIYYNVVLTRNAQNQYILSYEGYFNGVISTKTLPPANSLDALSREMLNGVNKNDFNQACVNEVRAQAALIPAVIFDKWRNSTSTMVNPYELLTNALVNFYLDPNGRTPIGKNYDVLSGIYARARLAAITDRDAFIVNMRKSIARTIQSFNKKLFDKIDMDLGSSTNLNRMIAAVEIPANPQYGIFTLTRAAGDEIFVSKRRSAPGLLER
jgi:hypothetical protein